MILCLDVGNSHIYGGVFVAEKIQLRFRYASAQVGTSDQLGLFLRDVLRENKINPAQIEHISLCSVVPALDYSVTAACIKYFAIDPFVLKPGVTTGISLLVKTPAEVGADRIANAIAAVTNYPDQDLIVIDFGTATTCCAISAAKEYLGGVIMPGLSTAMQSLSRSAAKLSAVEIVKPQQKLGKSTEQNIQIGLYYGQLGAMQQILNGMMIEAFHGKQPLIIATGGFAHLFEDKGLFSKNIPDLVLFGLKIVLEQNILRLNQEKRQKNS